MPQIKYREFLRALSTHQPTYKVECKQEELSGFIFKLDCSKSNYESRTIESSNGHIGSCNFVECIKGASRQSRLADKNPIYICSNKRIPAGQVFIFINKNIFDIHKLQPPTTIDPDEDLKEYIEQSKINISTENPFALERKLNRLSRKEAFIKSLKEGKYRIYNAPGDKNTGVLIELPLDKTYTYIEINTDKLLITSLSSRFFRVIFESKYTLLSCAATILKDVPAITDAKAYWLYVPADVANMPAFKEDIKHCTLHDLPHEAQTKFHDHASIVKNTYLAYLNDFNRATETDPGHREKRRKTDSYATLEANVGAAAAAPGTSQLPALTVDGLLEFFGPDNGAAAAAPGTSKLPVLGADDLLEFFGPDNGAAAAAPGTSELPIVETEDLLELWGPYVTATRTGPASQVFVDSVRTTPLPVATPPPVKSYLPETKFW